MVTGKERRGVETEIKKDDGIAGKERKELRYREERNVGENRKRM